MRDPPPKKTAESAEREVDPPPKKTTKSQPVEIESEQDEVEDDPYIADCDAAANDIKRTRCEGAVLQCIERLAGVFAPDQSIFELISGYQD